MLATKSNLNIGTRIKKQSESNTFGVLNENETNCTHPIIEAVDINDDNVLESKNTCSNGPLSSKWQCMDGECLKMNTRNTSDKCTHCQAKKQTQVLMKYAVGGYCGKAMTQRWQFQITIIRY